MVRLQKTAHFLIGQLLQFPQDLDLGRNGRRLRKPISQRRTGDATPLLALGFPAQLHTDQLLLQHLQKPRRIRSALQLRAMRLSFRLDPSPDVPFVTQHLGVVPRGEIETRLWDRSSALA